MKPYYEDHSVILFHGDCREILHSCIFGSIVTDVPYGLGKDYGGTCVDNLDTFRWAAEMIATIEQNELFCELAATQLSQGLLDLQPEKPVFVGWDQ